MSDDGAEDQDSRTEEATPQRREQARDKGQIPRSRDLVSAVTLIAGVAALSASGAQLLDALRAVYQGALGGLHRAPEGLGVVLPGLHGLAGAVLPFFLTTTAVAMVTALLQTGVPQGDWLVPDLERLNPLPRLIEMFRPRVGGWELAKTTLKLLGLSYLAWRVLSPVFQDLAVQSTLAPLPLIERSLSLSVSLLWRLGGLLLGLAVLDYCVSRLRIEREMRMSKREVREEMRHSEGDPQVKRRLRRKAREILRRRLAVEVPKADVVVVNPTHYAVALSYKSQHMRAPKVLAKGVDHLALRIRSLARASSIPVVDSPKLARELYRRVPVGKEVPGDLYRAVAEVLAYVYRIKNRAAAPAAQAGGPARGAEL